jgi:hypothetical protein
MQHEMNKCILFYTGATVKIFAVWKQNPRSYSASYSDIQRIYVGAPENRGEFIPIHIILSRTGTIGQKFIS